MFGHADVKNTVAVLFGGKSSEHEVSLRSAVYVLQHLPAEFAVIPVGLSRDGRWFSLDGVYHQGDFANVTAQDLSLLCQGVRPPGIGHGGACVPSVVLPQPRAVLGDLPLGNVRVLNLEAGVFFPALHGQNGEDGRLQGLLELAELAYVGCDLRASAIGIDKALQKTLARDGGIPTPKFVDARLEEWQDSPAATAARVGETIGLPCFVKPNSLGSAVGCGRARSAEELAARLGAAFAFDDRVLAEEPMDGCTEVECAFLGTAVHPRITQPGEIAPKDWYSYEAKYLTEDGAAIHVPAPLAPAQVQEVRSLTGRLARILGLSGLARIDFWHHTESGRFLFNEVNTLPGLTAISLFPRLWELEGVGGAQWMREAVEGAWRRHSRLSGLSTGVGN